MDNSVAGAGATRRLPLLPIRTQYQDRWVDRQRRQGNHQTKRNQHGRNRTQSPLRKRAFATNQSPASMDCGSANHIAI